jgi:hypothetical protein
VRHLGKRNSTFALASTEEAQVSSRGETFSRQEVQMALRVFSSRQTVLQAEVLRDKITPVHPNDAFAFLLHTAMPVLLESAERRPAN